MTWKPTAWYISSLARASVPDLQWSATGVSAETPCARFHKTLGNPIYTSSPREREIIALAAQGRSTKQIASALGISPFTVQDHLKAVFAKVGVQSRAELVAALYVRHYEPRRMVGSTPGPYGWYLDDYQAAAG